MADKGTQLGVAQVPIRGDLAPLDKDLDKARSKLDKTLSKLASDMNKKLASLGKAAVLGGLGALTAAVGGLTVALVKSVGAAAEEQEGIAQLSAAVRASGADWDEASEAIERYLALELQRTALDDGDGREAIARLTQATGDYRAALALMGLTQDLARAKGLELANAAEIIGKVSAGNTSILSRYGIVLEKGATATEALTEMQRRFAGQAEAYANTLRGQTAIINTQLGNISEIVGGALEPALARLARAASDMLSIIQTALEMTSPLFEAEFTGIADAMLGYGEGAGASFAQGIANAIPYLLATLRIIREIITWWLKPGSPPRLLPDLDKWGTAAMEAYFRGWTEADFGTLRSMSSTLGGVLRGMVAQGLLGEGEANPILRALRGALAAALDELRATGSVSAGAFAGIRGAGGAAGAQAEAYARRVLGVEEARLKVKELEERLATATTAEEVNALAQQLDAAREEQRAAEEALRIEEERLQTLVDEANLLERHVSLMGEIAAGAERVAAGAEKAAGAVSDLAGFLASVTLPGEGLPTGDSPFAAMFDTEAIQARVDEIVNKIMPVLFGPDGESGLLPKLKRFLEGDFKYAVLGAFVIMGLAIGTWAVGALAAMGPVGLAIVGIGLAVALLAKAWEEDWMGMRTALQEAWKVMEPILDKLISKYREALSVIDQLMAKQMEAAAAQGAPYGAGYGLSPGVMPGQGMPSIGGQATGLEPTWFRSPTHMLVGEGSEPELVSVIPRSKLRQSAAGGSVHYYQTINVQDRAYAALLALERDRYLRSVERGL